MSRRSMIAHRVVVGVLFAWLVCAAVPARAAQAPQQRPATSQQAPDAAPVTPAQLQALFDAYTIVQAQNALQLSDSQYGEFVSRLKALQETRRTHQQARQQIIAALRRLTNPQSGRGDDATISDRLKDLRNEDASAAADLAKAYDGVDQVLTVHQRARFRIFEERMEQQKLELVMRARQNARRARGGNR